MSCMCIFLRGCGGRAAHDWQHNLLVIHFWVSPPICDVLFSNKPHVAAPSDVPARCYHPFASQIFFFIIPMHVLHQSGEGEKGNHSFDFNEEAYLSHFFLFIYFPPPPPPLPSPQYFVIFFIKNPTLA